MKNPDEILANLHPICWETEFLDDVEESEGRRLKPYKDHLGYLTIGVGTLLEHGITDRQADALCILGIDREVRTFERSSGLDLTGQPREVALVLAEMAYQLGGAGLAKFKNAIAHVKSGNYVSAAAEMLDSKWAKQTPQRAERLADRMRSA